jgi:hypothetical protein
VLPVVVEVETPTRTSVIARAAGVVTKTASRILDDLNLIGLMDHTKESAANNSPDLRSPTELLLRLWPESKTGMYQPLNRVNDLTTSERTDLVGVWGVGGTSLSYKDATDDTDHCRACGEQLHPLLFEAGERVHDGCEPTP